ncbi:MAG TPA: Gfo/Idh/MocA family oxidoreductase [Saprospiraceae bacterium]|mgnify:FL=1|nr:Gfo/Idh/MocA family oxidoreductase [Saprospiraceae bacterium]HMP24158.1 Gfo/Idh/MocA family oxidoreductase [Saprospiraceae bacterium]
MSNKRNTSRRDFIKTGALATASFFIVPRHVLGRGFLAPSDKLNVAAIGAGGKGYSDIVNTWNNGANNIVAICDVDSSRAKAAIEKFPEARFYKDFRRMLEDQRDTIDAVTISTPDHTHAVAAMAAIQLGKHVYVQKPLTHNIREARQLTEAARQYRIVSQMGNQGASNPSQKVMMDWLDKGLIGKVSEVYVWTDRPVWPQGIPLPTERAPLPEAMSAEDWDLWIGPAQWAEYHPLYHPFKWRGWWNFGTGALGDMGCHLIDSAFRVLGLGYPTEVECSVGQVFLQDWTPEYIPDGCPPSSSVRLKFPPSQRNKSEVTLIWSDGGIRPFHPTGIPAGEPLGETDSSNGVLMIGKKGVITCGTYGLNPKLYLKNGDKIITPPTDENPTRLPDFGHQSAWVAACKAGFGSAAHQALTSSFDYAGPLTETVLMGNLAIRSYSLRQARSTGRGYDYYGRRKLLWDGTRMEITNFAEANQFVGRAYRAGW